MVGGDSAWGNGGGGMSSSDGDIFIRGGGSERPNVHGCWDAEMG